MAEETPKRSFSWRRMIAVLAGIALLVVVGIAILTVRSSRQWSSWQREAEIERDLRDTFPHLCPQGLVIEDCRSAACKFGAAPGTESYEVSCLGNDSMFGPALTLDATNCKVSPHSLTLINELEPEFVELHGKLRVCPASNPLAVTPVTQFVPCSTEAFYNFFDIAWAPNGRRIAYAGSVNAEKDDIFVMNPDGTGVTRLTTNPGEDRSPAWSPDSTRLAFVSDRDGPPHIYVMNADGTGVTRLTNGHNDGTPAWSPDGSKIAYASGEIYVMNADGSGVTQITHDHGLDYYPSWSPDGQHIVHSYYLNSVEKIGVINADGTGATWITAGPDDEAPSWSPDGQHIAFASQGVISEMKPDGTNVVRLTDPKERDVWPAWSPDSRQIAFVSSRPLFEDIYVMDADGGHQTRLTNDPAAKMCWEYCDYSGCSGSQGNRR